VTLPGLRRAWLIILFDGSMPMTRPANRAAKRFENRPVPQPRSTISGIVRRSTYTDSKSSHNRAVSGARAFRNLRLIVIHAGTPFSRREANGCAARDQPCAKLEFARRAMSTTN
jgi:hypothetical protein